jgi:hypothetical protein
VGRSLVEFDQALVAGEFQAQLPGRRLGGLHGPAHSAADRGRDGTVPARHQRGSDRAGLPAALAGQARVGAPGIDRPVRAPVADEE